MGFDAVTFQLRAKLSEVLVISRLDRTEDVNGRNVGTGERAIVHDLFDARASRRDLGREIGKATGPITNDGGKSAKPAISDQTAFDYATKHVGIDVAAAKQKDETLTGKARQFAGKTCRKRGGAGAFHDALL